MESKRIDVHHHLVNSFYREAVESQGGDPSGFPVPEWSLEADSEFNTKYGIGTVILSGTAPGACILPTAKERTALARRINDYCAGVRDAQPDRYGFFANLPSLLDGDLAFQELAYALDELKADGVTLFTRYGDGNHYLGHPDFKEFWAELDRREAVVFIHPTHPVDTTPIRPGLPQSLIEYPFETTKTAADMLYSKIPQTHKKCKIILPHAGGTVPFLITRPAGRMGRGTQEYEEWVDAARSFYFDVAVSCHEYPLSLLQKFAKPGHILFGTDSPYAPSASIANNVPRLDEFKFDNPEMLEEINNLNALALFPRLAQYYGK